MFPLFENTRLSFGLGLLGILLALLCPVAISVHFCTAGACRTSEGSTNSMQVLGTYVYPVLSLWRYGMAFAALYGVKPSGAPSGLRTPYACYSILVTCVSCVITLILFILADPPPLFVDWEAGCNLPAALWVALRVDFIISTHILRTIFFSKDVADRRSAEYLVNPILLVPVLVPILTFLAPVGMVQYAYFETSYWYLIAVPMHYIVGYALYKKIPPSIAAFYCAAEFTLCTVLFYTLGGADRPPGSFLLPERTWSGLLFFSLVSPVLLPMLICYEMLEPSYTGSNLLRLWRKPSPPRVALAATYAVCAGVVLYLHVRGTHSENILFVVALFPASICFIDELLHDDVVDMLAAGIPSAVAAFYSKRRQTLSEVPTDPHPSLQEGDREEPAAGQDSTGL